VTVRVPVLGELFQPGGAYTATISVRGQEELELVVTVKAEKRRPPEVSASRGGKTMSRRLASKGAPTRGGKPKAPAARRANSAAARGGPAKAAAGRGQQAKKATRVGQAAKTASRRKATTKKSTGHE